MLSQASPYHDLIESRVYLHYLRTGLWANREALIEEVERKFNPYHDDVGRFTSPPGVTVSYGNTRPLSASSGSNAPGRPRRRPQTGRILTGDKRPSPAPATSTDGFRSTFVRNAVSTTTSNADTYFELNKRQRQLDNLRSEAGANPDPLIFADFEDFQDRLNANRKLLDERAKIADRHVLDLLRAGTAPVDLGAGLLNIARGEAELRDYMAIAGAIPVAGVLGKFGKLANAGKVGRSSLRTAQEFGIPKSLSARQTRHMAPVSDGRSVLTSDPVELLDGLHNGAYRIIRAAKPGHVVVDFGKPIGDFWLPVAGKPTLIGQTQFGSVRFGKNGAHIVPANPKQW